jgi:hypothetical protein
MPLEVSKESHFGATPFDGERIGYHRCNAGEIAGMRLISPMSVSDNSWMAPTYAELEFMSAHVRGYSGLISS